MTSQAPPKADLTRLEAQSTLRKTRIKRRLLLATELLSWFYLALILVLWALLRFYGDVLWFPTVLLFGPRWLYAIPLGLFLPIAVVARRRLLLPLLLAGVVLWFPLMGFTVPWRKLLSAAEGQTVRVLTCNLCGREAALANTLQDSRQMSVDVICLQECPAIETSKWTEGWNFVRHGEIAIASRYPIDEVHVSSRELPPSPWPPVNAVVAVVRHPHQDVRVCAVHLRTPRQGLATVLDRDTFVAPSRRRALVEEIAVRREESRALTAWLATLPDLDVVAGDFNMPTDSANLRQYWTGRFTNAFSAVGFGLGHTKHTPVGPFQYGLRIDHILLSPKNTPLRCRVGLTVGSDHLPVYADMAISDPASESP